jgi:hypothetical protein
MPNPRDRARAALSHRPIPVATVDEVLSPSARGRSGGDQGIRLVREMDPAGEEFGVRRGMGGPWRRLTKDRVGPGGRRSPGHGGLPAGPWVYLKEGAARGGDGKLGPAVRRAVLILASSADVSGAASARWTGLVLEAKRVSRRLTELDAPPG